MTEHAAVYPVIRGINRYAAHHATPAGALFARWHVVALSALLALLGPAAEAAPPTAPVPAPAAATPSQAVADKGYSLNLRDADVRELIATVAEITGKNFIVDPRVAGTVTVISASPMSRERIYETFLSTLHVNGFLAIPSGDAVKILPDAAAVTMAPASSGAEPSTASTVVTRVIDVRNIDVRQLQNDLRPLLPQNAHMSAHPESNTLVVTDTAANVERLVEIVRQIDRDTKHDAEIVQLRKADAAELAKVFIGMLQAGQLQGEARRGAMVVADPRSNSLVISGPPAERKSLRALIASLDRPASSSGFTEVITLKHAAARDLMKVMKGVGEQQMKRGEAERTTASNFDIQADDATNSLIITAPPDVMGDLKRVIARLDVRRAQVHVEGIIAEISTDKALELGVEWRSAIPQDGFAAILRSPVTGGETSRFRSGADDAGGVPSLIGKGLTVGYFQGGDLRGLLKALQSDTGINILSTPSVVTLDNQKALIHVGQNVPILTGQYQTPSGNNLLSLPYQTYERRDVGIKLAVIPQITEGDTVRLEIKQEVSNVVPGTASSQSITTSERTIETTVLVDNAQILVLGGLVSDDSSEVEEGVPVLGQIPVVGQMFKTTRTVGARKNLVVFLRPTILRDSARAGTLTQTRYDQVRDVQLQEQAKTGNVLVPRPERPTLPAYPPAPDAPAVSRAAPARTEPVPPSLSPWGDL